MILLIDSTKAIVVYHTSQTAQAATALAVNPGLTELTVTDATWIALQSKATTAGLPDPRAAALMTWSDIRAHRKGLLSSSDWTEGVAVRAKKGPAWCAAWDAYRNALRDLPQTPNGNPNAVVWPTAPAA